MANIEPKKNCLKVCALKYLRQGSLWYYADYIENTFLSFIGILCRKKFFVIFVKKHKKIGLLNLPLWKWNFYNICNLYDGLRSFKCEIEQLNRKTTVQD